MSNIGLLSFYTADFQSLHDVTGVIKDKYCIRHNYKHIVKVAPYGNSNSYYAYQRIKYLYDLFWGDLPEGRGIDIVLVMNGHAVPVTHSIKIEDLISKDKGFAISTDVNGINAGVFIVRKSEWSKKWLDFLLSVEDKYTNYEWKEQNAIMENWQNPEFKDKIQIVDQEILNSYDWDHYGWSRETKGQFKKGISFCQHQPGKSIRIGTDKDLLGSRIELFSSPEFLQNITYV